MGDSGQGGQEIRSDGKINSQNFCGCLNAGGKWIYSPRSDVSGIRAASRKGRSQSARRPEKDMEIFRDGGLSLGV